MRIIPVILAAAILMLAAAEPALAGAELFGPDARVFTLAGGGTKAPRDGLPAGEANFVEDADVAARPDGSVALALGGRVWLVGLDGRLHALPPLREQVGHVAVRPDGTLLAVSDVEMWSLAPGATAWVGAALPKRLLPAADPFITDLAALPGGFAALSFKHLVTVVDGQARRVRLPARVPFGRAVAALPDGRLAVVYDFGERLGLVTPGGLFGTVPAGGEVGSADGLAGLGDGTIASSGEVLHVVDASGATLATAGAAPGLGNGDGGPPAAALFDAESISAGADGALVGHDIASVGGERSAFDQAADVLRGGRLRTDWLYSPNRFDHFIRAVVPGATARPLAAVAPATYRTLAEGRVAYVSTFAGHAVVVATIGGREVARAEGDIAAGGGELALSSAPPRGDVRLRLTVTAPDGRIAIGRAAVTTLRRLSTARARTLAHGMVGEIRFLDGAKVRGGACRRMSAGQAQCEVRQRGRCVQRLLVVLRPDGARAFRAGGRRACRAVR